MLRGVEAPDEAISNCFLEGLMTSKESLMFLPLMSSVSFGFSGLLSTIIL